MTTFEFIDELPPKVSRVTPEGLLDQFVVALRAQPGRWAKWPLDARNHGSDIKRGQMKLFRGGEFDAICRNGVLYVRYLGGGAS